MVAVNGSRTPEGSAAWWAANVLNSASRWCVPVFLMVSGALLLDPRRIERPRDFYRRRMSRVVVPLAVWTAVYLVFRAAYLREDITAEGAARDVAAGTPFLQLYFLYVLLGLYLLTPFLKLVLRHTTRRMQLGFAGVLLGLGVLDQVVASFAEAGGANVATRFLPFAGYFVLGWVLRDITLDRRGLRLASTGFVLSVMATVALVGLLVRLDGWGDSGRYLYGFLSPPVVVMSVAAFVLLRAAGRRWVPDSGGRTTRLSALTFGVYLVHPLVLYPLQLDLLPLPERVWPFLGVAAVQWGVTVTASLLLTLLLRSVPYVRRTV
jgi:surface polysaccharide O-acyltransferase-like enzyme